jgi:hypothetical protein
MRLAYNLSDAWIGRPTSGGLRSCRSVRDCAGIRRRGGRTRHDRSPARTVVVLRPRQRRNSRYRARSGAATGKPTRWTLRCGSTGRLGRHWNLAVHRFAWPARTAACARPSRRGGARFDGWTSIEAALPAFDAPRWSASCATWLQTCTVGKPGLADSIRAVESTERSPLRLRRPRAGLRSNARPSRSRTGKVPYVRNGTARSRAPSAASKSL